MRPHARMQVSCSDTSHCSDKPRKYSSTMTRFLSRTCVSIPLRKKLGTIRLVSVSDNQIPRYCATSPAVTRSSRTELLNECRHHWPRKLLVRSRYSASMECVSNRCNASKAATLGLRLFWLFNGLIKAARVSASSSMFETS